MNVERRSSQVFLDLLIGRLTASGPLSPDDQAILAQIDCHFENVSARTSIIEEGSRPRRCCLIVEGITSRFQLTKDGERQIHAVQVAGDLPDLQSLHLGVMDHSLRTLPACRLAFFSHEDILAACRRSSSLSFAIWRESLIDAAVYRAAIVRIGKLDAIERVAHFLCEMKLRLGIFQAMNQDAFDLEMTQQEMADLLALSFVSINRALRELRERGLVQIDRRRVEIQNWDGLVALCDFDPTYLHYRDQSLRIPV